MKAKDYHIIFLCFTICTFLFLSSITFPVFVSKTLKSQNLIVIDAGHGGNDPGKVGSNQTLEKDINLILAKKVKLLLEKKHYKVKLTRDGDYNLSQDASNEKRSDLKQRKELIHRYEPKLVISIHQNSYPSKNIKGAQVFYYAGFQDSKNLADSIQSSLIKNLDPSNHRVAKSNTDYYLLRDNPYPTVIVECGFLSNEIECKKLSTKTYQEKAAKAIVTGILNSDLK